MAIGIGSSWDEDMNTPRPRKKIVLLDLEQTIIDEWGSGMLLSVGINRTKKFLSTFRTWFPDDLGLMSWAVWNDKDKADFEERLRPDIESNLSIEFSDSWILSMDQWSNLMLFCNKQIPRDEMFDLFKKEEVLFLLARKSPLFRGREIFLIDDTVDHGLTIEVPTNDCSVTLLNVNDMPD